VIHSDIDCIEQEDFDEAISNFKKAIKTNRNFYRAYNNLGNAYKKKNEFEKAIEAYKLCLKKSDGILLDYLFMLY
jgi:tetratricopeptide (TPR) repeat protein